MTYANTIVCHNNVSTLQDRIRTYDTTVYIAIFGVPKTWLNWLNASCGYNIIWQFSILNIALKVSNFHFLKKLLNLKLLTFGRKVSMSACQGVTHFWAESEYETFVLKNFKNIHKENKVMKLFIQLV